MNPIPNMLKHPPLCDYAIDALSYV